ncbi:MAG: alpha/beta fold hydrolase, partial [Anaerolineales bacterium]
MPIAAGLHYFSHNETLTSRPPVILIHGAGGNYLSWPAEIRRLPGQRIFALDLPGHGKSEGIGRQLADDYAQSLREF